MVDDKYFTEIIAGEISRLVLRFALLKRKLCLHVEFHCCLFHLVFWVVLEFAKKAAAAEG
jgi:hypothetical protein